MERTIMVKGVGSAKLRPDTVRIGYELSAKDREYDKAVALAGEKLEKLRKAMAEAGFDKQSLKTTDFDIDTVYDSVRDKNGDYKRIFAG